MTEMEKTCIYSVIRFRGQSVSQMSVITSLRRLALEKVIIRFERRVRREAGRGACGGSFRIYLGE